MEDASSANLLSVKESKDKRHFLLETEEDGEETVYTVTASVYFAIGAPARADRIADEALALVKRDDERIRAVKKAGRILSYADNNEKTLFRKLRLAGFSDAASRAAVEEVVSLGFLDEKKQLFALIREEANYKLSGPRKIRQKFMAKGYSPAEIDEVTRDLIARGEIDFAKSRARLIEKKLRTGAGETPEERKNKLKILLYRNGYDK